MSHLAKLDAYFAQHRDTSPEGIKRILTHSKYLFPI